MIAPATDSPTGLALAVHVKEACRISGLGRTRLYAAISKGEIDARKCGARTLVIVASLQRYLAALPRLVP